MIGISNNHTPDFELVMDREAYQAIHNLQETMKEMRGEHRELEDKLDSLIVKIVMIEAQLGWYNFIVRSSVVAILGAVVAIVFKINSWLSNR